MDNLIIRGYLFIIGDSFGRDFANILNESDLSDQLEISYFFGVSAEQEMDRVEKADFVFYGTNSWGVSEWVTENVDGNKLYVIGNKDFGNSNGIIYINRSQKWYFDQTVRKSDDFLRQNEMLKQTYGEHYIDMTEPLLINKNEIRVFTEDHYFISQDCKHLTRFGARYYSEILDLSFITENR